MDTAGHVLFVFILCLVGSEAAHFVELKERDITHEEQKQVLELLQLEVGANDEVPNVRLNSNFFGSLKIGDNDQDFEVVFDTGSDALWVYSEACTSCQVSHKHTFSRSDSHSYHRKSTPFSIKYGTGESHGTTGTDMMKLGDLEVEAQAFGQCDQPDEVMRSFPFDGIVGLSRPMFMDPNGLQPIMETVKDEEVLHKKNLANTFSFFLGREAEDKSYLIFGGSHHMLHEGAVHWVPTLSKNIFWELPLDDILIHHKSGNTSSINAMAAHQELTLEQTIHHHHKPKHHAKHNVKHSGKNIKHHSLESKHESVAHNQPLSFRDPYTSAPVAEVVNGNEPASSTSDQSTEPGVSADGYSFSSIAEPVLLELETLVEKISAHSRTHLKKPAKGLSHHAPMHKHSVMDESHRTKISMAKNHEKRALGKVLRPKAKAKDMEEKADNNDNEDLFDIQAHFQKGRGTLSNKEKAETQKENSRAEQHSRKNTVTTHTHKAQQHTTTSAAPQHTSKKAQGTTEAKGSGELLSDFKTNPGTSINPCQQDSTHPCIASMDSGHSLISGPPELVRELKKQTMPTGKCVEQDTKQMPDVSFVIGGKLFTLEPMDYLIELEGQCTPAFRERPFRNGHDWVLGEHFMRTFYTVFDYDDMRVGLSRLDNVKAHLDDILSHK